MKPRIVVVGSINMDLVVSSDQVPQKGETVEGRAIHYIAGGKGANQAVACARLGADVSMIGAVGNDAFGNTLLDTLSGEKVNISRVQQLDKVATGVASIIHAEADNRIIVVPGANGVITPADIEVHKQCIMEADLLIVQLEIPIPAVLRALQIANQAGVRTILNPAPAKELPQEIWHYVNFVTPNETEFGMLYEKDVLHNQIRLNEKQNVNLKQADVEKVVTQIQQWVSTHSAIEHIGVILTMGAQGALASVGEQVYTAVAPAVNVVDTTGAGDCLNGAFAVALARGYDVQQALELAVTAASISVTGFGAQGGLPTWEQLLQAWSS